MNQGHNCYFQGHYEQASRLEAVPENIKYKIAGLVFTGQHGLARNLFQTHLKNLKSDDMIFVRFHIGISYARTSEYSTAKKYFIENLKLLRSTNLNSTSKFLVYQGFGFYRFFFSKHKKSLYWAEKAYFHLKKSEIDINLFLAFSLELIGLNLIEIGKIRRGLGKLNEAYEYCKSGKLNQLEGDILTSILLNETDFDLDIENSIKKLKSHLAHLKSLSDYSKSGLILQITRLYIFKGNFKSAHQFLTENFDIIYSNENKRRIAALNTIMADLLLKKGQLLEALSLTKIARKNLDEIVDISLLIPILVLEIKILNSLKKPSTSVVDYLKNLIDSAENFLFTRQYLRNVYKKLTPSAGEDPVGDLLDEVVSSKQSAYLTILESQTLSLIPKFFNLETGKKYLLLVNDKKALFTIDENSVDYHGTLTKTEFNILSIISSNGISKSKLISSVWGYDYDQLRHDNLIYSAFSRIKKKLGLKKHWIYGDDNKYYSMYGIEVINKTTLGEQTQKNISTENPTFTKEITLNKKLIIDEQLNYRQAQTIKLKAQAYSVSDYAKLWNVTRMTALRDLKHLCDKNLAFKTGVGKSTKYFLEVK